ncbi:GNAT family N-acetyltransferase [Mesorhizobium sp. VK9D]|uniref:GNAT family N-acetyltransferase n=1 Tax=Mesorhizobium australafricanum TaxID=3072311 RepID=UPI002A23E538|nr:GNAT family N-acetyltransferase [Mesorhizobium sp. VK9D]MDX8453676.1 GNAT family N-acetyltransferase [Mesorhizobium sp. VK9D]
MSSFPEILLRPATSSDAAAIATMMRASLNAFDWMPVLHTPDEDLFFIRDILLPSQQVTVAEAGERIVGFIAVNGDWVEQLYLDPAWTGQGIGSRLLVQATGGLSSVKLHCFQANSGARRFYERHGFRAEAFGDGSTNEEGLPDILYVLRR